MNIVPIYRIVFFDVEVKTFDIEGGKDPGIGLIIGASSRQYRTLHRIQYRYDL